MHKCRSNPCPYCADVYRESNRITELQCPELEEITQGSLSPTPGCTQEHSKLNPEQRPDIS